MEHPKAIGDRTTLAVMLGLQSAGYELLVPFGENLRYDLGADRGDGVLRIQCKTGRLRDGAVRFAACSSTAHHGPQGARRHYGGQIDAFGVYCAETSGVYLVPIEQLDVRTEGALRVSPARNGQLAGTRQAARFLIATIALASEALAA